MRGRACLVGGGQQVANLVIELDRGVGGRYVVIQHAPQDARPSALELHGPHCTDRIARDRIARDRTVRYQTARDLIARNRIARDRNARDRARCRCREPVAADLVT